MKRSTERREASPRANEGDIALLSPSRGRSTAPHLSIWLPVAAKVAAAAAAIVVLAIIGAKAGAHAPHEPPASSAASAIPPGATAPLLAAAFLPALPSMPIVGDGGKADPTALPAEAPPPGENVAPLGGGILADGRVVLNAASETELTKLPGIGPSRARAILTLRQQLKKFRAVEDLLRIKGIGRKMLRRLRPNVVLDRPSDDARTAPPPPAFAATAVSSIAPPTAEHSDSANH
jgi:competence protein ComEA